MENVFTYQVRVRGEVCESDINTGSPLQARLLASSPAASLVAANTDQAGLVGWLRYLHGMGFDLLSFERIEYIKE